MRHAFLRQHYTQVSSRFAIEEKRTLALSPACRFALASSSWCKCSTRYSVRIPWWPTTPSIEISSCRAIFTRSCFCGSFRRSPFPLVPFTRRSPLIRLIRICVSLKTRRLITRAPKYELYSSDFYCIYNCWFLPRIRTLTTSRPQTVHCRHRRLPNSFRSMINRLFALYTFRFERQKQVASCSITIPGVGGN